MRFERDPGPLGLSKVEKLSSVVRVCRAGPNSVRKEGPYCVAEEPNSFGIPSVDTCPGRTPYCEADCYAIDSEKRTVTHEKLVKNQDILEWAGTVEAMADKLREAIEFYIEEADRLKVPQEDRQFRIHWSGDFFSVEYAEAWKIVILENPDLQFYVYTRSFQEDVNVVPTLSGIENLDVLLSVDRMNVHRAAKVLPEHPDVRVAYLVDYKEEAEVLIEILGRQEGYQKFACPENMRKKGPNKFPVITPEGGACARCKYCIGKPSNYDVIFVKRGKEFRPQAAFEMEGLVPVEIIPRPRREKKVVQPVGEVALASAQNALFD